MDWTTASRNGSQMPSSNYYTPEPIEIERVLSAA